MRKVQNNQNWAFMIISDHFKPLWWEEIKIRIERSQLGILNHFLTTLVEKDGIKVQKNQNWAFQIVLGHFGGKRLEKVQNNQNWVF